MFKLFVTLSSQEDRLRIHQLRQGTLWHTMAHASAKWSHASSENSWQVHWSRRTTASASESQPRSKTVCVCLDLWGYIGWCSMKLKSTFDHTKHECQCIRYKKVINTLFSEQIILSESLGQLFLSNQCLSNFCESIKSGSLKVHASFSVIHSKELHFNKCTSVP